MKLTQIITAGLVGTFALIGSATAQNAFNDAEKAVEYRQKALSVMQNNFAAMGDMVKGEVDWDSAVFAARAADFAAMSGIPWSGFETAGANLVRIPMHCRLSGKTGVIFKNVQNS